MKINIIIAFMLWVSSIAQAQFHLNGQDIQTITVTGRSSILESPDQITIEVTLSDEFCAGPKENIDALTGLYADALVNCGADKTKSKLIREDRFDLGYTTSRKTSEMISRLYRLELTSTKQYEKFCDGMTSKGVAIKVIAVSNSKIKELRQRVQREAIVAAKDKSLNYVSVAGGKLGRVLRIDEISDNHVASIQSGGDERSEGVVFPMISNDFIECELQVVFELQ